MRYKKFVRVILCCVLTMLLSINILYAADITKEEAVEYVSYEYPIKPGMEYWGKLDHAERLKLLQIPSSILEKMNTSELISVVLKYPCFSDMFYFDAFQEGFDVVVSSFNGLQEVLLRDDAGQCLLNIYRDKNLVDIITNPNIENSFDELQQIVFIETLLAQPEISDDLADNELTELMNLTEKNREINESFPSSSISGSTSAYYRVLAEQQNVQPLTVYDMYVYTPKGTPVAVTLDDGSYDKGAKYNEAWREQHLEVFPSITHDN